MKQRSVEKIIQPGGIHWVGDGFRVHNFIPHATGSMQRTDPFVLLDYNSKHYFAPTRIPRGVGPHPHRGFETVTIAYKGKVEHHDSHGGGGIIGEGEVQWMTAGAGILHKEYHELEFSMQGGEFQVVQLWVNLPAKYKMTAPKYQAISRDMMKAVTLANETGSIDVIAGEYAGVKGVATTFTPINLFNLHLKEGAVVPFSFNANWNVALLAISGTVLINDTVLPSDNFALMANDGESFIVKATTDTSVLLFGGEPIGEPIVSYGPFVMNTCEEINQAIDDFNAGLFGSLE